MAEQKPGMTGHGPATAQAPSDRGTGHGTQATGGPMHSHGTMNTTAHEKTFSAFVRLTKVAVIVIIGLLIFMALVNA